MNKKDYYITLKNTEKLIKNGHTNFLDFTALKKVKFKLKGLKYKELYPYKESEKVILYKDKKPKIRFIEILCHEKLTHSQILGSLYGTKIDMELIGDIVIYNNHYYIMVLNKAYKLVLNELTMIGKNKINLKEVSNRVLDNYVREYDIKQIIVVSPRIDNVISKLMNISRDKVKTKFMNNEIIVNYELCHKESYILKENDIFSVRKHGKYKFINIVKNTKKDNYIIQIYKYIDKT